MDLIESVNKKEEQVIQQKIQKQMEWWEAMSQRETEKDTKAMSKKKRLEDKKKELRNKKKPSKN